MKSLKVLVAAGLVLALSAFADKGISNTSKAYAASVEKPEIVQLSSGRWGMTALAKDGSVWTWGENDKFDPQKIKSLGKIVSVSNGAAHTMALDAEGQVWTWGMNQYGQIGDGQYTQYGMPDSKGMSLMTENHNYVEPYRVQGLPKITSIAAGRDECFALAEDGNVWTWGNSGMIYLDRGDKVTFHMDETFEKKRLVPRKIEGLQEVIRLFAGYGGEAAFAVKKDGTAWGWGMSFYKMFGESVPVSWNSQIADSPVKLDFAGPVKSIQQFPVSSVAFLQDGSIAEWGVPLFEHQSVSPFSIGDSQLKTNPKPVASDKLQGFVQLKQLTITNTGFSYLGLKPDGTVWTLGTNDVGQRGVPGLGTSDEWVQVKDLPKIKEISSLSGAPTVIAMDGSVWEWGTFGKQRLDKPFRLAAFGNSKPDKLIVSVNGMPVQGDSAKAIPGGEVTAFVSALKGVGGITVQYGKNNEFVTILRSKYAVKLIPNSNVAYVNGKKAIMPIKSTLSGKEWIVPLAWLAKNLGGTANWDASGLSLQIKF